MSSLTAKNNPGHALRYEVVRNALYEKNRGERSYFARVHAEVKSLRELAETMVREGSKYKATEIFAILQDFTDLTIRLLQEGYAINVGSLVRFRPSIRGKFTSEEDVFTRGVHQIVVTSATGSVLRNIAANTVVERVNKSDTLPKLAAIHNTTTGRLNTLCHTKLLTVLGKRLTWDIDNPNEGFFATLGNDSRRCEVLHVNKLKTNVLIKVPQDFQVGDQFSISFHTQLTETDPHLNIPYPAPLTYEA